MLMLPIPILLMLMLMLIAIAIAITSAIVCYLLLMLEAAKKERAHILVQQRWQGQSVPEHRSRRKKKTPIKGGKKRQMWESNPDYSHAKLLLYN